MQSSVPGISGERDSSEPGSVRSTLSAFVELGKPGVAGLVMVTMLCGALVAPGPRPLGRLLIAMFGTALVVAAANALNMYIERETDALMRRTASRPLPSGRLAPEAALWFALACGVVGLSALVLFVNLPSAGLALAALASYVLAYTPLKRNTGY